MNFICQFLILIFTFERSNSEYRKACYFTNWSQYRNPPGKYLVKDVKPSLCTHIIYSFATMQNNHLSTYEWNDEEMYKQFSNLRQQNPTVKLLLAVGGWNFDLTKMTYMLSTPSRRADFIASTVVFLRKYGFDGLDLDFEWPSRAPSPASDRPKFTLFVNEARIAYDNEPLTLGRKKLMLTIAIPASDTTLEAAYEIQEISKKVDFLTVMAYDFAGSWSSATGHHAPLYAPTASPNLLSINSSINYLESKGVPLFKLNLGIPFYGRGFILANPSNYNLSAPVISGNPAGPITAEYGFLSYYEILKYVNNPVTKVFRPCDIQVPYFVNGNLWIGYDDVKSVNNKADYIRKRNLGGFSVWALDLDDFSGTYGVRHPLLTKLNEIDNLNFVNDNAFNCGPGDDHSGSNNKDNTESQTSVTSRATTANAAATGAIEKMTTDRALDHVTKIDSIPPSSAYDCLDRNPCTRGNIDAGKLYFPADDAAQFVQCSSAGQCFTMTCGAGTVWSSKDNNCGFASDTTSEMENPPPGESYNCENRNPCQKWNIAAGKLYFPADDASQFIQCSTSGQCFTVSCDAGTVWDPAINACGSPPTTKKSDPGIISETGLFNCDNRSPCTAGNISGGKYYFPAEAASNFIQCSSHGQCFTMSCGSGTVWDAAITACNYPPPTGRRRK